MSENIIIALLTILGTAITAYMGVAKATQITVYRIDQLEKKVDKHNSIVERTFKLEEQVANIKEDLKER